MKTTLLIFLAVLFKAHVSAQDTIPKTIGILMIGDTPRAMFDIYIIDSTRESVYKFDVHTIDLYADKSTLKNIYSCFEKEKKYDSLPKYDKSFGTFLFAFRFENKEKVRVVTNRIQSAVLLQKIICKLSAQNDNEAIIIKEINSVLAGINY